MARDITVQEIRTIKKPIESDFALSEALISVEDHPSFEGYLRVTFPDLAKANLQRRELNAMRVSAIAANFAAFVGTELKLDLRPSQKYLIDNNIFFTNASRTKDGWAGFLSKTSKSISEETLQEKATQIVQAQQKKGLIDKIMGK